jgi:hypothetical protein
MIRGDQEPSLFVNLLRDRTNPSTSPLPAIEQKYTFIFSAPTDQLRLSKSFLNAQLISRHRSMFDRRDPHPLRKVYFDSPAQWSFLFEKETTHLDASAKEEK